jgi:hypothetical protein
MLIAQLAECLDLGTLLETLREQHGGYTLLAHWQQGEFHHDVVLRLQERKGLRGDVLVVATNCNGGIKEVLSMADVPDRYGLWHLRCPDNPDFHGSTPAILDDARTAHWFDPCDLLADDARSEMRPGCRRRQLGGGWEPVSGR